jgi:hypothetical protein
VRVKGQYKTDRPITLPEMYAAAQRELKRRTRTYWKLVQQDKMHAADADYEIAVMAAITEHFRSINEPTLL